MHPSCLPHSQNLCLHSSRLHMHVCSAHACAFCSCIYVLLNWKPENYCNDNSGIISLRFLLKPIAFSIIREFTFIVFIHLHYIYITFTYVYKKCICLVKFGICIINRIISIQKRINQQFFPYIPKPLGYTVRMLW